MEEKAPVNDFGRTVPSAEKNGDVVYAQTEEVLALKNCIEPP